LARRARPTRIFPGSLRHTGITTPAKGGWREPLVGALWGRGFVALK
jgi:hypothetical protein